MSQAIANTEAITTLGEAERCFGLRRNEDRAFFREWQQDLPNLSALDRSMLEDLRRRYVYHRSAGNLGDWGRR